MPEKYDFSKSENQQKFEQLPQKERDEIVGEAREEAAKMQEKIKSGKARDYTGAKKLIKTEKGEIILTPEQQAAKQELIRRLSDGYIYAALKIKDKFNIRIEPKEIIDKIPQLQNLLNRLQEISPEFYSQALKSIDIVISLIQFKDNPEQFIQEIQESPFL